MTIRVTRLECENFMKLVAVDIKFDGRVTEFAGKNGAGKSTLFLAIKCSLEGKDAMPTDPIRHGTEQSFIRTHLAGDDESGLVITCRLREGGEGQVIRDLVLETPEGARFPSPQAHLKKLISDHLLDPLEFIEKLTAKEQYDALRGFVPGFDFETNERMRKGAFEKRTEIGRDQKKAQAAADAVDVLDKAPGERIDEAALTAELQSAGEKNTDTERRRSNREKATGRVVELRTAATKRATDSDLVIAAMNRQIEELKSRILAEVDGRQADINRLNVEANELQAKLDAADPLPEMVDAAVISTKLGEARRCNRAIEDWETQRARKQQQQRDADNLSAQYDALTIKIDAYDQSKKDAIQQAKLPVKGLGFGDGAITFNDAPFKQASKGEQMRTAFALSVAKRPELRFCWIRDASLLDDEGLALVHQMAEEFDCQVLLEFVRPNSSNSIVIEDGRVQGVELPPSKFAAPTGELELTGQDPSKPDGAMKNKTKSAKKPWRGPNAPTDAA